MDFKILLLPTTLVLMRFIVYWYKLRLTKKYFNLYDEYLEKQHAGFQEHKPQIIQLFKDADLPDFSIHRLEPVGYGKLRTLDAPGYQNLGVLESDIISNVTSRFHEAIGVFRHRMLQSVNPLFWIEFLFKLPQFLFGYLGVLPDKIVVKLAMIIYWLLAVLLGLNKFDILDKLLK